MSATHGSPDLVDAEETNSPSFVDLLRTFGHIGLINFGGPAGQIALMHKVLVEEKGWIDEDAYLRALNFCHLLPGPEAQQLATYVGWKLHGVRGGLAAGLLFILPGAAIVLGVTVLYAYAADMKPVAAALLGVKAAILAIVVEALLRVARRALNTPVRRVIAVLAFLALAVFAAPFPAVMLTAGAAGFGIAHVRPDWLKLKSATPDRGSQRAPSLGQSLRALSLGLVIWGLPLALVTALFGRDHVLVEIGLFFAKLATVSFGGAYAVLTYMAQEAVTAHHWLSPKEMVDGLGMAETTPGPLILVTQYVGFLAAFRQPAPFTPLVAGVAGAGLTLWMTFAPCFLWIFVAAPWLQRLEGARRLQGALSAITAAVVGVIANLTFWFGLHVLFRSFIQVHVGPSSVALPVLASIDWRTAVLAATAAVLLFRFRLGVLKTLAISVIAGLALAIQAG